MFNSKTYAILALALTFAGAAPAQAGWDGWQWMTTLEKARPQQSTVAPTPGYESFAYAPDRRRYRRVPSPRPAMTGHTFHHPGH